MAWLATDLAEGALAVCGPHAERMAVPNGWRLDDRRAAPSIGVAASSTSIVDDDGSARWEPHFDHADDLDGLLAARSPLLARAFGGGPGPQPRRRRRPPRTGAAPG